MLDIPLHVNGIDIETKSTAVNAWVLSIGMVKYRVRDLQIVDTLNLNIDPNCTIQQQLARDVSDNTMRWWFPENSDKWSPSKIAQEWTWGGKMSTETAVSVMGNYLRNCRKDKTTVHTMRGPDFDYVVLKTLYEQMNEYFDVKFSMLDSHRTVERGLRALGIPPFNENELKHISPTDNYIEHVAVCDASKEAYETAKYYHLLWWIRHHGYDKAIEVAKGWQEGTYVAIPDDQSK